MLVSQMLDVVFVKNCFKKDCFSMLNKRFELASATHSYNTKLLTKGLLFIPSYNSVRMRKKSIIHSTTLTWNHLPDQLNEYEFLSLSPKSLKILLRKYFMPTYNSEMTSCLYNSWALNSFVVMEDYIYSEQSLVLSSRIVWVFIPFCHHWSIKGLK